MSTTYKMSILIFYAKRYYLHFLRYEKYKFIYFYFNM